MKFELVLILFILKPIFGRQSTEGIQIETTVFVYALVNFKMLAILLLNKSMTTIRADQCK
jgi:hypothetical protein